MPVSPEISSVLIVAASNVGAVAVIGKWLMSSVEKSNESLPLIMKTLETQNKAIEELYNARNEHADTLRDIKTTHRLRGCDQPVHEPGK